VDPPDPKALLDLAVRAAKAAGDLLIAGLRSGPTEVSSKSTKTDLVSDLDRASEELIISAIRAERPGDGFLGEEGGTTAGTSPVRWVVDPLDGTVNYLYGIPVFAVSIAAEVGTEVVAGVVHDPSRAETFTAVAGGGSYCNGRRLKASDASDPALALVGTGFAYDARVRNRQGRVVADLLPRVRDIRRAGAAALDLCAVGAGRLDAYFESGTHHWDRAAGALVATEAGAWVGDLEGGPPSDELVVAATAALAEPFRRLLAAAQHD
jgi:myo-inositol-1(or 4)-monophosphatase